MTFKKTAGPAAVAALALTAALAAPTSGLAQASDPADPDRRSPLPPGACVTHGAVGLAYEVGVNCRVVNVDGHPRRFVEYATGFAAVACSGGAVDRKSVV